MGKLTLQDIARLADVSTATVSRALHSPHQLREKTLAHVLEVIQTHKYIYNAVAGDFSRQQSSILGAFVPWELTGGKINATLIAVQNVVNAQGYPLFVNVTHLDPQLERQQLIKARERALAGLLFCTSISPENQGLLNEIMDGGMPCIFLWDTMPDTDLQYVGIDNAAAAHEMTRYLISLGHRSIAFVGTEQSKMPRMQKCVQGFMKAMEESDLPCLPEYMLEYRGGLQYGRDAMYALLGLPSPPTAVFYANDMLAIGAMAVCREMGLRVPDDISVAGFDDIDLAPYTQPALTTVRVPSLEMGQLAGRCALDLIRGEPRTVCRYSLKTSLSVRESCGPPRVRV